jgi:peptidoglycan LD-endopeptidase CwlK
MRTWSKRSLQSLYGIHPDLRRVMDRALQISPVDFIVIEGLRTPERQKQLVAQGASRTLNSRHITGHAVDLLPIGPNGKPAFDWPLYDRLAPAVKQAARELGVSIVWGGDWKSFRDGPHFELDRNIYPADDWSSNAKPPEDRKITESRTMQGGALAGVGVLGTQVSEMANEVQAIAGYSEALKWVFLALALAGIGLTFYARWSDWKDGHK